MHTHGEALTNDAKGDREQQRRKHRHCVHSTIRIFSVKALATIELTKSLKTSRFNRRRTRRLLRKALQQARIVFKGLWRKWRSVGRLHYHKPLTRIITHIPFQQVLLRSCWLLGRPLPLWGYRVAAAACAPARCRSSWLAIVQPSLQHDYHRVCYHCARA